MNKKICCFCGHKYFYDSNIDIFKTISEIIGLYNITEFYSGGMGDFDKECERAVLSYKRINPDVKLYLVSPYFKETLNKEKEYYMNFYDEIIIPDLGNPFYKRAIELRNRWMVDNSDFVFCYIRKNYGGAYNMYKYAIRSQTKILNI